MKSLIVIFLSWLIVVISVTEIRAQEFVPESFPESVSEPEGDMVGPLEGEALPEDMSGLVEQESDTISKAQRDRQLDAVVTNLYPVWTPGGGEKKKKVFLTPITGKKQSESPKIKSTQSYVPKKVSPPKSYSQKSYYAGDNPLLSIKTNIPYWLVLAPNLGVELYIGDRTSLVLDGMFSYWNKKSDDGTNGVNVLEFGGEFRYWLNDDKSKPSHFFGVYMQYIDFDIKLSETGHQGTSFGGGISYGYYLPVSGKWAFEFGLGLGVLKNKMDVYKWNSVMENNVWQEHKTTNWIGPTKIKVAVIFKLGNKR